MFKSNFINNPESFNIDNSITGRIFELVEKNTSISQNGIINIIFVSDEEMKALNSQYRGKESTTDVLSFHYFDDFSELSDGDIAGEVVMSEAKIISQGKEYTLGSEKEFYKLLLHSLLHIIGYDHEEDDDYKIMEEKENRIWKELFEK